MTYPSMPSSESYPISPRSRAVSLALAIILGPFGAHRFYTGQYGTAVAQLFTLGGLGLWALYDAIMIATGNFRDGRGRRVLDWEPTEVDDPYPELPPAVAAELAHLRQEMDEMHERLEFAERMLSRLPGSTHEERP